VIDSLEPKVTKIIYGLIKGRMVESLTVVKIALLLLIIIITVHGGHRRRSGLKVLGFLTVKSVDLGGGYIA
jgi:hypothetical protein